MHSVGLTVCGRARTSEQTSRALGAPVVYPMPSSNCVGATTMGLDTPHGGTSIGIYTSWGSHKTHVRVGADL